MQREFVKRFRPQALSQSQPHIEQWFATAAGQYVLNKERRLLQQLPRMHGYHLMELGVSAGGSLLNQFDNLHRFALSSTASNGSAGAVADFNALPLPSDIIETAIVHHALEFSSKPHAVLNEVARVVAPGGHIVLFIFNPFCLFGLLKWPGALLPNQHIWKHHSLRRGRLLDWLRLLNFRPVVIKRGGFGPLSDESNNTPWWRRWGYGMGLPAGAFYCIVARKQVIKPIQNRSDLLKTLKVPNMAWQQRTAVLPSLNKRKEVEEC